MIKPISQDQISNVKVNVFLKNGKEYLGKDVPSRSYSEQENWVTFWNSENALISIPREEILSVEMYFEKNA